MSANQFAAKSSAKQKKSRSSVGFRPMPVTTTTSGRLKCLSCGYLYVIVFNRLWQTNKSTQKPAINFVK